MGFFKQYVVAYLDILGFSKFIEKAEKENNQEERKRLARLLYRIIPGQIKEHGITIYLKQLKLECLSFSDSIIISAPVDVDTKISPSYPPLIAVSIKAIQIAHALLGMGIRLPAPGGFLVRGAIHVGNAHRSKSNIVGTGYQVAAKNAEKSGAPPRVLLTDSAKGHWMN